MPLLNHGKPQLQLWIDSLNEMFLSRWTAHEQWNITFILLKTRREEGHQFVNLLPDRHATFVIIQWITCVVPKLANLLNINTHFFLWCFYAIINLKIVNIYKAWPNMKIWFWRHRSVIPWFWRHRICYCMILTSYICQSCNFCYKPYIPWILLMNLFKPTHPSDS
jgi:hypothetical protein